MCGQHNTWAWVGAWCDPGTVYGKQHQHHQQCNNNDTLNVDSQGILLFWLFFLLVFLCFSDLRTQLNDLNTDNCKQALNTLSAIVAKNLISWNNTSTYMYQHFAMNPSVNNMIKLYFIFHTKREESTNDGKSWTSSWERVVVLQKVVNGQRSSWHFIKGIST